MSETERFEELFAEYLGAKEAVAVNSGSSALLGAMSYLKEEREVEYVITTPFTFKATTNAIILAGMIPVFVDIESDTYSIDPSKVEQAIKYLNRTKPSSNLAMLPVHLFGNACNMQVLKILSHTFSVPIVEDTSQSLGAEFTFKNGSYQTTEKLGTIGLIGTFSFYATKNLSTFQGGMITTNDTDVAMWLKMFKNHGAIKNNAPMRIMGMNLAMPELLAFIGQTNLRLHKIGMLAELGSYGVADGFYKTLVPQEQWYRENPDRWFSHGPLTNALKAVEYVKEITK